MALVSSLVSAMLPTPCHTSFKKYKPHHFSTPLKPFHVSPSHLDKAGFLAMTYHALSELPPVCLLRNTTLLSAATLDLYVIRSARPTSTNLLLQWVFPLSEALPVRDFVFVFGNWLIYRSLSLSLSLSLTLCVCVCVCVSPSPVIA
jgi:hypothetical protein